MAKQKGLTPSDDPGKVFDTEPSPSDVESVLIDEALKLLEEEAEIDLDAPYDPETGEIKEPFEFYRIKDHEAGKRLIRDTLKGKLPPHDSYSIILGAIIDFHREKISLQGSLYRELDRNYNFFGEDYLKSTFVLSKIENRLCSNRNLLTTPEEIAQYEAGELVSTEGVETEYRKLKDRLDFIQSMLSCLEEVLMLIKMIERSSWGFKQNKGR